MKLYADSPEIIEARGTRREITTDMIKRARAIRFYCWQDSLKELVPELPPTLYPPATRPPTAAGSSQSFLGLGLGLGATCGRQL